MTSDFFDQILRLYRRIARKMKSFHSRNYFQDREYLEQRVDDELGVVKVMSRKYFSEVDAMSLSRFLMFTLR